MLFNTLFDSLLLVSITRATPSAFHRRTTTLHVDGVVITPPEPVLSVAASITVPTTLTGDQGDQVYFLTGIDGFNTGCSASSFQVGVLGTIGESDQASYNAIYHDPSTDDGNWVLMPPDISPGDYIVMVVVPNPNDVTTGYGMISNPNKGGLHYVKFGTGSSSPICSNTGGWFIQTRQAGNNIDFGKVNFRHADVNTSAGMYYPSDPSFANIISIPDDNEALYTFTINGENITVQHA